VKYYKHHCAFIYYRKAFDSVDRILLWQKLLRTSIDGNMLVIIQNMHKNAKSCVRDGSNNLLFKIQVNNLP
jgi:hypothetical protein